MANYCRQWISEYAPLSRPLLDISKPESPEPLQRTETANTAFDDLKLALQNAPAPNYEKLFHLFVHEKGGFAQAALTQGHCGKQQPIAYISTKLDPVASALPGCLKAVAATYYAVIQISSGEV
uniref:Reverse transcriptase/retrotransposon-derived protein RNase H-like domain-containing protein n=1 Tax=Callorhinchus milii TaxID=7868 RepID=A0A4W3I574_CALMI